MTSRSRGVKKFARFCIFVITSALAANAQQTIFNVSSPDVVAAHHAYYQGSFSYQPSPAYFDMSSTLVYGLGHNLEFELNGIDTIHPYAAMALGLGVKGRIVRGSNVFYAGDQAYLPTNHSFAKGNYLYVAAAHKWKTTRLTAGLWNSINAIQPHNHTGVLLGIEHGLYACDWQSGAGSNGVLACGINYEVNPHVTISPGYQVGNFGVTSGNHAALIQLGLSF